MKKSSRALINYEEEIRGEDEREKERKEEENTLDKEDRGRKP